MSSRETEAVAGMDSTFGEASAVVKKTATAAMAKRVFMAVNLDEYVFQGAWLY